jgi:uncharacterized protein with GYD domain
MVTGSYSVEGWKGVLGEGGSSRVEAVRQLVDGAGGTFESMYFTFGSDDFVMIAEGTDNVSAAALAMLVTATGAAKLKTTVLLTAEEIDAATQKALSYRPPGQ